MQSLNFDIDALHKVQYDLLVEFDRVCRKHQLTYFLGFGSMLGAVRHNGFIPWDDDIDILMMYKDYLKLQSINVAEWKNGVFLQTPETDIEYNKSYLKLRTSNTTLIVNDVTDKDINHGVAIDIEPLIGLADDKNERKKQYFNTKIYMLLRCNEPPMNHGRIMYWGGKIILGIIPEKYKAKLREKYLKKITAYDTENTEYLYVVNGNIEMMKDLHKRSVFSSAVMQRFERAQFPIPVGYDEWLTTRYGDYMCLPPEDQQGVKLGQYIVIDLQRPYSVYKGMKYCCK